MVSIKETSRLGQMKIKRYFAADMREAIQQVRMEQGPDAVILSNRNVDGGVEIVAATDYDETQAQAQVKHIEQPQEKKRARQAPVAQLKPKPKVPSNAHEPMLKTQNSVKKSTPPTNIRTLPSEDQDNSMSAMREELHSMRQMLESQLSDMAWKMTAEREPLRVDVLRRLMKLGLGVSLAKQLASEAMAQAGANAQLEAVWRRCLQAFSTRIPVMNDELLEQGGIYALVGPTGVGKTTTIAKLAARFALRHGNRHVALITTDQYRVGGHEQLLNYARILDIPVRSAQNAQDLQTILNSMSDKHLVLIDTSGLSHKDERLPEQLDLLEQMDQNIKKILVLSTTTQQVGCKEIVKAYSIHGLHGCILTKVDETASLAGPLSMMTEQQISIAYITDGQRVPEDIHIARPHSLVSRSVSIMQHCGEAMDDESMAMVFGGKAAYAYV